MACRDWHHGCERDSKGVEGTKESSRCLQDMHRSEQISQHREPVGFAARCMLRVMVVAHKCIPAFQGTLRSHTGLSDGRVCHDFWLLKFTCRNKQ